MQFNHRLTLLDLDEKGYLFFLYSIGNFVEGVYMMGKTGVGKITVLVLLLFLSASVNQVYGAGGEDVIQLKYPAIIENHTNVPFGIELSSPLLPGYTLSVYSNEKLATSVKASSLKISWYHVAIRLAGNGTVEVRIEDPQGKVLASRVVKPKLAPGRVLPGKPGRGVKPGRAQPESSLKVGRPSNARKRGNGFNFKFPVRHRNTLAPGQKGYIELKGRGGTITLVVTEYLSGGVYTNLTVDQDPGPLEVSTRIE